MELPKLIVLEGISGVGKSTIIHPVNKLCNYKDVITARFTPSMWVYNMLLNRPEVDYETINLAIMEKHELHIVWLMCSPETALKRCIAKNDMQIENLEGAASLFQTYFEYVSQRNFLHLVNAEKSVEEVVLDIGRKIYGLSPEESRRLLSN